jgi:acyl-[acyl carrier protein]--UDP-N-acetylglucosamine O-acyltransferase
MSEHLALKQKWRALMRREAELQEEIDRLKQDHADESNARTVKNLLDRSKSRGRENNGTVSNGFERD